MPEFKTVVNRNISGRGVVRVPSKENKRRLAILYLSVIRDPRNLYLNREWNPNRSRYANLAFMRNGYVLSTGTMEFENQQYDSITDITSQNLLAIKCGLDATLKSFENLVRGIGATPGGIGIVWTGTVDPIADYEYLSLGWDEVRISCYADTAINARLVTLAHDVCEPEKDTPKPPPPPPPPPDKVPPGTNIANISPPYQDEENPDNFTSPYVGDGIQDLPVGDACVLYNVKVAYINLDGRSGQIDLQLFGEIEGAGVGGGGTFIYVTCRGGPSSVDPPAGQCLEAVQPCAVFGSTSPDYAEAYILTVTEVT